HRDRQRRLAGGPARRNRLRLERTPARAPGRHAGAGQARTGQARSAKGGHAMKLPRRTFLKLGGLGALLGAMPRALAEALGYPRALQGPMIGAPAPDRLNVWVRPSGLFDVALEVSTDREFRNLIQGSTARARAEDEGCVVLHADGLQPATDYWYRLRYA